jgi:hypothetical protein
MAWRNIEIDHLTIGYLILRGHDRASDQLLPPVSGASDPGALADTDGRERPPVQQQPTRRPHELVGEAEELTDRHTAAGLRPLG